MVIERRAKVAEQITVSQLWTADLSHCEHDTRKSNGSPTEETNNIHGAFSYLSGSAVELARDLGPRKLMPVPDSMVRARVVTDE